MTRRPTFVLEPLEPRILLSGDATPAPVESDGGAWLGAEDDRLTVQVRPGETTAPERRVRWMRVAWSLTGQSRRRGRCRHPVKEEAGWWGMV